MRALVLRKTRLPLELEERPNLQPQGGEAIVRLKTAALNRRDFWIVQDRYPGIRMPVILGSDGAGIVTEVGADVDRDWVGKEVVINPGLNWGDDPSAQSDAFQILGLPRDGTLAESIAIPAAQLYPKPAFLSWDEAGALPLAGLTAYRALFVQGGLQAGETVLVSGIGGGVATLALLFAVAAGARAWATSSSADKLKRATELGAEGGFLYTDEHWLETAKEQQFRPDLIIDGAGGPGFDRLIDVVRPGGRIVNYGATAGPLDALNLRKVFWKQLHLIGSTMGSPREFEQMLAFVIEHEVRPAIDRVVPLEQGNEAFSRMAESTQFGKLVLKIG